MTAGRINCAVPLCRRTLKADSGEWLCGKHWMLIPKNRRRVFSRINRQYRKQFGDNPFWRYPPGSPKRLACVRLDRRWRRTWARLKRLAIERALGIG